MHQCMLIEKINLYNFKYKNEEDYYDIEGKSIKKSLMKTPINGVDFHPLLV